MIDYHTPERPDGRWWRESPWREAGGCLLGAGLSAAVLVLIVFAAMLVARAAAGF